MENDYNNPRQGAGGHPYNDRNRESKTIPVVEEQLHVDKKVVETGKVHIAKKVVENETSIALPLTSESYNIERVPVNQVVDQPPQAVRYEGDTMIIPVLREVLVVQKRYEVLEEIRITRQVTQEQHTENVTLLKEEVQVNRQRTGDDNFGSRT